MAVIGTFVALLVLVGSGGDTSEFAASFGHTLGRLPHWLVDGIVGSLQLVTFASPVVGLLALVIRRRFARLGMIVLASGLSVGAVFISAAMAGTDVLRIGRPGPGAYGPGAAFPTTAGLAVLCAGMLVDAPWWTSRWRRAAVVVCVCGIGARLGSALAEPATILLAVAIAATASAVTHLIVGVPNRRAKIGDVVAVLARFGHNIERVDVDASPGFQGVATFMAHTTTGESLFVKVVSRESWVARLPGRIYRSVRFRDLGAERPFASLGHRVDHEALCALKAHADGVPTPRLVVVTPFPHDAMMLAFEAPRLRSFTDLEPDERTTDLLSKVWKTVATLHGSRTVHHLLNSEHLKFDDELNVVVVDFSAAELGATERALSPDIAELLAITAARIGVDTAVAAAVAAVGPTAVALALPRLQPLALSRSTRSAVKDANCLDELKAEVQRVTGAVPQPIEDLERIKPRTVLGVVMATLGLWALVPQFLGAGDVWGHLKRANWSWAIAAMAMSVVTYVGAAIALDGSLPERLPIGPNLGVQVATSFVGVAAPGGGLALTARFLQRRGIDTAVTVAAVGIDTAAGVIVHFGLLGIFIAWAGTSGLRSFQLPSLGAIVAVALAVAALMLVGLLVRRTRLLLEAHVMPPIRRAMAGIVETARNPANLVELFGGSAAITLGYLLALEVSVRAFGAGPPFTSVALVYLVGSIISSAAPTPGGIGAVEATLVAGLTSAGMPSDTALGAVLLFRVTTFWIPLLPGWIAFTMLQRSGDV
jgi:glycosyltransferase 2 family protein